MSSYLDFSPTHSPTTVNDSLNPGEWCYIKRGLPSDAKHIYKVLAAKNFPASSELMLLTLTGRIERYSHSATRIGEVSIGWNHSIKKLTSEEATSLLAKNREVLKQVGWISGSSSSSDVDNVVSIKLNELEAQASQLQERIKPKAKVTSSMSEEERFKKFRDIAEKEANMMRSSSSSDILWGINLSGIN